MYLQKHTQAFLNVNKVTLLFWLPRQCHTYEVRFKDGDPYPYCVRGCELHTKCGETRVPEKHLEASTKCSIALLSQLIVWYSSATVPGGKVCTKRQGV